MATTAMGPTMAGGMQPIVKDGYELLFLPDVNNNQLQQEGQSPVFYWVPNQVRMARKDGPDKGDHLFQLLRFAGEEGEETADTADDKQVAGGLLTFTTTGAPPDDVLQQSQDAITAQFSQSGDFFWGIRSGRAPVFRPAIVTQNITSVSNISPTPRGLPMLTRGARAVGEPVIGARGIPPARDLTSITTPRDAAGDSNIDPWYWNMQGQGSGSIDPSGQNAYSALVGSYPAAILYAGFHGTAAPLIVIQNMKLKMWSPQVELRITGHWKKIFDHFSAHASGRYLWASLDIKAELNRMRTNGDIEVEISVDSTIPGGEEVARKLDESSDLVFQKFMEAAQTMIFEPPQPQVEAAQASTGGGPWGAGAGAEVPPRRDRAGAQVPREAPDRLPAGPHDLELPVRRLRRDEGGGRAGRGQVLPDRLPGRLAPHAGARVQADRRLGRQGGRGGLGPGRLPEHRGQAHVGGPHLRPARARRRRRHLEVPHRPEGGSTTSRTRRRAGRPT